MRVYRPDIDGLRAIAVMLVILFHVGVEGFSGGYVGVDVFFVISGYLITKNILSDIVAGQWSLRKFYIGRVMRLFPALWVTLALTLLTASFVFSPQHLERLGSSLAFSVFSLSNFFFWSESGYFDTEGELKPLLHTWSLSVEEQFYLLWPALLCICAGFGRKVAFGVVSALIVFGLVVSQYGVVNNPDAAFYLAPYRVYEFAIGAALVFLKGCRREGSLKEILFIGGLSLIAYAVLAFDEITPFPGVAALVPTVGAALIIYSGTSAVAASALRIPFVVWLGVISYSLYLVHWPLIVFYKYAISGALGLLDQLILIAVTLTLAVILHYTVERKFRRGWGEQVKKTNSRFAVLGLVSVCMLVVPALSASFSGGWEWRLGSGVQKISRSISEGYELRAEVISCIKSGDCSRQSEKRVLVLGDSYAEDYALAIYYAYPDVNVTMGTMDGCKALVGFEDHRWNSRKKKRCAGFITEAMSFDFSEYDLVVLGHSWVERHAEALESTLLAIVKKNPRVVVFGQKVQLKTPPGEIVARSEDMAAFEKNIMEDLLYESAVIVNATIKSVCDRVGVRYVDPSLIQGGAMFTNLTPDGEAFFYDQGHMTVGGAMHFGALLRGSQSARLL